MEVPTVPGQILAGKFRVERVLGEGGMGVVVAAHHLELDEPIALKFLRRSALANAEVLARFLREARAATKIKNEHVAKVLDVGKLDDGSPYIVMEHLRGTDLSEHLQVQGPLPVATAVSFVLQALEAIAEAHALGIVHRDLKPSNLFLTRGSDGMPLVKVLDFGISKVLAGASATPPESLTQTDSLLGSPLYMSPEQLAATKSVDERADIWALGIILYELLIGRTPFAFDTLPQICSAILHGEPVPPRAVRPELPIELEATIARCLRKDASARFTDVAQLATALAIFDPQTGPHHRERIARIRWPGGSPRVDALGATTPAVGSGEPRRSPVASTLEPASTTVPGQRKSTPASRSRVAMGIALALLVVGGILFRFLGHPRTQAAIGVGDADGASPALSASSASVTATVTVDVAPAPSTSPQSQPALPSHQAPTPRVPALRARPAGSPPAGDIFDTQK